MGYNVVINIALALIGIVIFILLLISKVLYNLNSLLENIQVKINSEIAPRFISADQGISDEEMAAISGVIFKLCPDKRVTSIRIL